MIVNTSVVAAGGGESGAGLAVFNPEQDQELKADQPDQTDLKAEPESQPEAKGFDEQKFWREIELIAKLGELKAERDDIAAGLSDAKGDAKSLKDSLSEANSLVSELESQLRDKTDEFMDAAFKLCDFARGVVSQLPPGRKVADGGSDVGEVVEQTEGPQSDGWRLHPTADLLNGMKGNKGKRDSVVELAPTVGHLEDLRALASKECVAFNEKLPKGCGKGFAQSIEDLLIDFIAKWSAQQSNPEAAVKADELVAEVRESAKQNGWGREDCLSKETDSAAMRSGFTAFGEGRPYTDVALDDLHAAKQWMTGWVSGEVLKSLAE